MSAPPTTEVEPTFPYPARFRWLKRGLTVVSLLVLCLLVVRVCWGRSMQKRLGEAHARMSARGAPVVAEDLNPEAPVPPKENAAAYYGTAITLISPTIRGPSDTNLVFPDYPPFPAKWHRLVDAAYAANKKAYAVARTARPYTRADWGFRYASPMVIWPMFPQLNSSRQLANNLGDAAMRAHLRGNDAMAVEFARDVRHVARTVDQQRWLIWHLVANGIDLIGMKQILVVAPALEISGEQSADVPLGAPAPDGPATRGQVVALINELLTDPPPGQGTANTVTGAEFIFTRDFNRWMAGENWVLGPLFDRTEVWLAQRSEAIAGAATQPTDAAAKYALAHAHEAIGGSVADGSLLSTPAFVQRYSRLITRDAQLLAERRMAAVSLAVRMFRLEARRWPRSLDELVPRYLPAVPRDPFRADGGPLSYVMLKLPAGATNADGSDERPVVYHVGDNGRDDSTSGAILPPTPLYAWHHSGTGGRAPSPDQWRDLSRFTPAPPPPGTLDEDGDGVAESVDANRDGLADERDE